SKTLSGARRLRTDLTDLFAKSTDAFLTPTDAARGCLLIGTASVEAVHRPAVRRVLRESLDTFNAILEERLRRAIAEGELDSDADPAGLASVISAMMHSLAVRARAGESRRALDKLGKSALNLICGKQAKRRC
ncbi:TetR-like C-terminal domain-containing protein, partial [Sphingosinicella sp.]|uniref:TetR-like C-terminal domain-containing protein n=1 Tax=Sphingosinicella sp. TaxID=1917971 RepID=UPI004037921F